ncbi:MAG: ABC transporter ATP-binding protein [Deltaproteobacteria bacterium]|nr:MAG: ABC transporter ATP-binding protein [Deltaproteobacteria bacterium]UCH08904.1 MAG: ABC transporter ATP-binding protein [Deltaproteobacteria bacterium]
MAQHLLETLDLKKDYRMGDQVVQALRGISISVSSGEFLAVMGPSGSGKSTFMNLLGCLDTPTAGKYLLEGNEVSSLSPDERAHIRNQRIGFVFQSFNLLARTSALENVALPLRYSGTPRKKRLERAEEVLSMVGLSDRANHHPSQLSGGEQQRVAIARSLVCQPAIILADEPTGALDTRTGIEVMSIFQDLNAQGMTVVIVTHEPEIAAFARRRLIFRDGSLVNDKANGKTSDAKSILADLHKAIPDHFDDEETA